MRESGPFLNARYFLHLCVCVGGFEAGSDSCSVRVREKELTDKKYRRRVSERGRGVSDGSKVAGQQCR